MKRLSVFLFVVILVFGVFGISNIYTQPCVSDLDGDGDVDGDDFSIFKSEYFMIGCYYAPVQKTGQTTSYRTGDDGDEQAGVSYPNPRFTDNGNGTVTDNLTSLIWLKQANYNSTGGGTGPAPWNNAVDFCKTLATGQCGLSDGSSAGDWRLPNVNELQSLIDFGNYSPVLPSAHPFTNVQFDLYWSSTTYAYISNYAWLVNMHYGYLVRIAKPNEYYVWPVRGGI